MTETSAHRHQRRRDEDAEALIGRIGPVWPSYPGIVFDVDAEVPELRAIARLPEVRRLNDLSRSTEYRYRRSL